MKYNVEDAKVQEIASKVIDDWTMQYRKLSNFVHGTNSKFFQREEYVDEFKFVKKFIDILYANTNDMTFARYPIDSDKHPHFYVRKTENITIDLDILRIWVCKIFEILDGCTGFVDFQIDEIKDWLYEMQQAYGE